MIASTATRGTKRRNRLEGSIQPITAKFWLGAERPGVQLGPEALDCGLRARWWTEARDYPELLDQLLPTIDVLVSSPGDASLRLNQRTLAFEKVIAEACNGLAQMVATVIDHGDLALSLGGDHALAAGSVAGAVLAAKRLGVVWVDAHTDINTPETSPSGHLHGMPVAALLGIGQGALTEIGGPGPKVRDDDICFLGVRDIDPGERAVIRDRGIWTLTMEEWHDRGIVEGLDTALARLVANDVDAVHVSFDVDVLDPTVMLGTGTRVPGGLTFREASCVLRRLRRWDGPIRSADFVELNPMLDPSGQSTEYAVALLAAFLGEPMR